MIRNIKDIYKDEIGVIVLNGPSLNKVPLDWLNKHETISCNHIYRLDGFVIKNYVLVDTSTLENDKRAAYFYGALRSCKQAFVWEKQLHRAPVGSIGIGRHGKDEFHADIISQGTGNYASTAWVCVQLAYLMGFSTVLLVGFDCNFDMQEGYHFYKDEPHDFTHHPPVAHKEWYDKINHHMGLARVAFDEAGRKVINCTPNSGCKAFEFGDYKDY